MRPEEEIFTIFTMIWRSSKLPFIAVCSFPMPIRLIMTRSSSKYPTQIFGYTVWCKVSKGLHYGLCWKPRCWWSHRYFFYWFIRATIKFEVRAQTLIVDASDGLSRRFIQRRSSSIFFSNLISFRMKSVVTSKKSKISSILTLRNCSYAYSFKYHHRRISGISLV